MGVELNCDCDECGKSIDAGDYAYCEGCIEELKERIEELEAELEKCKEGCNTCNNKVECVVTKSKK